jgi:hypothetical protein
VAHAGDPVTVKRGCQIATQNGVGQSVFVRTWIRNGFDKLRSERYPETMCPRWFPASIAVIVGAMLIAPSRGAPGRPETGPTEPIAPAEDTSRRDQAEKAQVEKVAAKLNAAAEAWFKKPEASRPPYSQMLRRAVDSLDSDEIRLAGIHQPDPDFNQDVFRRWGTIDPEAALKTVRQIEDANAAEISLAGTGLEGGPGEAMSAHVFMMYLGAVEGWAQKAPKAAWEEFKNKRGAFSKSEVVKDYFSSFHQPLFEPLAKADPEFAFAELIAAGDDELVKASLLRGYLRGAPNGQDWPKQVDRLLEKKWERSWLHQEIRCGLVGRWLADDAGAAEKWFREGNVEDLHWSDERIFTPNSSDAFVLPGEESDEPATPKQRQRHSLGEAAGYWAARDFPAALRWMQIHDGLHLERGFDRLFFAGVDHYFDGKNETRYHLLKQLAKLPGQADRDFFALTFAKALWVFDGTRFLGQPPPDKGKWLEETRNTFPALALTPETERKIIEKLR